MKKTLIVAGVTGLFAVAAHAQSSVTLYGLIDAGLSYTSNDAANTGATWRATSNMTSGSRFGLRGAEDLGGGLKAIFTLEGGFDLYSGGSKNGLFARQSFVGLAGDHWGSFTLGRQYESMVDYVSPLSLANMDNRAGGAMFAHPFDNDNLAGTFRINNAFKFSSANYGGFSFGGLYGAANGGSGLSDNNRAYSIGAKYANGPLYLAAAYTMLNEPNSATNSGGAVSSDYGIRADKQQTFGAGGSYAFGPASVGFVWTQTQLDGVIGYGNGTFAMPISSQSGKINNYELNGKYAVTPAWSLSSSYVFSDVRFDNVKGKSLHGNFQQVNLMSDYALSKRTDVYVGAAYQNANGDADHAFIAGASGPSEGDSQVLVTAGMRHSF
ncbi:porin [Pararobbsia silviterrae]|uniref:Porin n=1 Tax=Pararobbsia silviterrae TaxID=1792498 RepID=A0A494Y512_9BURK|nr:porin [Pararobbsia silviterrae]RKP56603.1 porin [Pararobbsia silviterrae]